MYCSVLDIGQPNKSKKHKNWKKTSSGDGAPDTDGCCSGHGSCGTDEKCKVSSESAAETIEKCRLCGECEGKLQRCSRCRDALYCSRDCQKQDWKTHKKVCKSSEDYDMQSLLDKISKHCNFGENSKSQNDRKGTRLTLDDVKVTAGKLFPGERQIDLLSKISTTPTDGVFIGLVAEMHFYVMRHGIHVQDRCGSRAILFFYLDFDKPEPYFKWSDLKPGKYICICNPGFHVFMDGQIGFRIDEASEIKLV